MTILKLTQNDIDWTDDYDDNAKIVEKLTVD